MKAYILFVLILMNCVPSRAQDKHVISGKVVDEKKAPLRGATIFLTGRMNSTTSDTSGNFSLNSLVAGNYSIVVTMIGFKPIVKDIAIYHRDTSLLIQLKPQATILRAVTVIPDKSRIRNLKIFKREFLGESRNASQCKMLNSDVLAFSYDKKAGKLRATADDVLIIENDALGYQLKYVLLGFVYDESRKAVIFSGYPSFEPLKGTAEDEAQWKINRRRAFRGSIHQFIRSIYDQNCKATGFVVYKIKNRRLFDEYNRSKEWIDIDYRQVSFDSLLKVNDEHFKTLNFSDALYVIYTKAKEANEYEVRHYSLGGVYTDRWVPGGQVSIVNLFGPISIDENGLFKPINNLYFEGYMGWEKIADLVPYEYSLEEQN